VNAAAISPDGRIWDTVGGHHHNGQRLPADPPWGRPF
jgi:hypothetical protein